MSPQIANGGGDDVEITVKCTIDSEIERVSLNFNNFTLIRTDRADSFAESKRISILCVVTVVHKTGCGNS